MTAFSPNDQVLLTDTATTGLSDVTHPAAYNNKYAKVVRQSADLLTLWVQPYAGSHIYQILTSVATANSDTSGWLLPLPTITVRANHVSDHDGPY